MFIASVVCRPHLIDAVLACSLYPSPMIFVAELFVFGADIGTSLCICISLSKLKA